MPLPFHWPEMNCGLKLNMLDERHDGVAFFCQAEHTSSQPYQYQVSHEFLRLKISFKDWETFRRLGFRESPISYLSRPFACQFAHTHLTVQDRATLRLLHSPDTDVVDVSRPIYGRTSSDDVTALQFGPCR